MKFTKNIGMLLLAAWLILSGWLHYSKLSFAFLPVIMGILAPAAGIFILLGPLNQEPPGRATGWLSV